MLSSRFFYWRIRAWGMGVQWGIIFLYKASSAIQMSFFSSVLNAEPKTSAATEVLVFFPSRLPPANPRAQPLGQSL